MTGADQCSSTAVRCLIRPSRFVPEGTPGQTLLLAGQPRRRPDDCIPHPVEEKQQHIALGLHQMAITVTHAARD